MAFKIGKVGVSKRHAADVQACRDNVELAHAAAIEEGWARDYNARARCESGWTGDRCSKRLDHKGPHSNE